MIKGLGRVNRELNVFLGKKYKNEFEAIIDTNAVYPIKNGHATNLTLYSFSGTDQFYDQLISIFSFVSNVGIPKKWVVISDGTHTKTQEAYFRFIPYIDFIFWDKLTDKKFATMLENTREWQIKKFFSYCSIPVTGTTILLDSDILFFSGFKKCIQSISDDNWFLSELYPHLDEDYKISQFQNYTNSGFLILNKNFNWNSGIDYMKGRINNNIPVSHFTEQTAIEIVVKENKFNFLDPRLFIINLSDHFTWFSGINHAEIAMRHFVGPIRFRMWKLAKEYSFFKT